MTADLQMAPPARAYRSTAFTPGGTSWQKIPIGTVSFDPAGAVDTSHYFGGSSAQLATNGNKYVVPIAGVYEVAAQVAVAATASGQIFDAGVWKNGSQVMYGGTAFPTSAGNASSTAKDALTCAVGDTLELYCYFSVAVGLFVASYTNFLYVKQVGF